MGSLKACARTTCLPIHSSTHPQIYCTRCVPGTPGMHRSVCNLTLRCFCSIFRHKKIIQYDTGKARDADYTKEGHLIPTLGDLGQASWRRQDFTEHLKDEGK